MPHHNLFAYHFIFTCKQGCKGEEEVTYSNDTLTVKCASGHEETVCGKEDFGDSANILDFLQQKLKESFRVDERFIQANSLEDFRLKIWRLLRDWLNQPSRND